MNFVLLDIILKESARQLALEQRSREIIADMFADAQAQLINEGDMSTFYVCNYLLGSKIREEHSFHARRANVVFRALFNPFPEKDFFIGSFWSNSFYTITASCLFYYKRTNITFNTGRLMALQVAEDLVRSGQADDLIFEATL